MKMLLAMLTVVMSVLTISVAQADECRWQNSNGVVINPFCESQRRQRHERIQRHHGHHGPQRCGNFSDTPYGRFLARNTCGGRQQRAGLTVVLPPSRPQRHHARRPQAEWGPKSPTRIACQGMPRGYPFKCGPESPTGFCICP
jgi:hypothetical protein